MITVKEEFVGSDKWKRAIKLGGADTIVMWLALKRYAHQNPSDGFVPDEDIDELLGAPKAPRKALKALVDCGRVKDDGSRAAGLVEQRELGWQLHDWDDHGESADEMEERRRKARDRKRRQRDRSGTVTRDSHAGQSVTDDVTSRGTERDENGTVTEPPAGTPTRVPTQPNPTQAAAAAAPDGKVPCPADLRLSDAQAANIRMGIGLDDSQIQALTVKFVNKHMGNTADLRSLDVWRKCLSSAVCGDGSDARTRPPKAESDVIRVDA